jgi:hypothetical protein
VGRFYCKFKTFAIDGEPAIRSERNVVQAGFWVIISLIPQCEFIQDGFEVGHLNGFTRLECGPFRRAFVASSSSFLVVKTTIPHCIWYGYSNNIKLRSWASAGYLKNDSDLD